MTHLHIQLIGPVAILKAGRPVKIGRKKAIALLAYLAVNGSQRREHLARLFWSAYEQHEARGELRRILSTLRKAIGKNRLQTDGKNVSLIQDDSLTIDRRQLQQVIQRIQAHPHTDLLTCTDCLQQLEQTVPLIQGQFMQDFALPDCPDFDHWQYIQQDNLRDDVSFVYETLAQHEQQQGQTDTAIHYLNHLVDYNPTYEAGHQALMQLYASAGRRDAALRQYQLCARLLDDALGMLPSEEMDRLYDAIQNDTLPIIRPESVASIVTIQRPLTTPTEVLVGREAELSQILHLLQQPTHRLLTLHGMGGIGKTRLALEVAHRWHEQGQSVQFVSLVGINTLWETLAAQLSVETYSADTLQAQLIDHLRDKHLLLILDNLEHLIDHAADLSDLLNAAPQVKVLVTSRQRLKLQGETVIELKGLAWSTDTVASDALHLFVQTAQHLQPTFAPTDNDLKAIKQICARLQGLPLAIKLAASWTRTLSCQDIVDELDSDFDFLNEALTTFNLRSLFQQSWRLLDTVTQTIYRRLAIFQGSFKRQAATHVTGVSLSTLLNLVDHALLVYDRDSQRFHIHPVLLPYLLEMPLADEDTIERSFISYYQQDLHKHERAVRTKRKLQAIITMKAEYENVIQAWRMAIERENHEALAQMLDALYTLYDMTNWLGAGYAAFNSLIDALAAVELTSLNRASTIKARAMLRASTFGRYVGDLQDTYNQLQTLRPFFMRLEDTRELALYLRELGVAEFLLREFEKAQQTLEESLSVLEESHHLDLKAVVLNNLGMVLRNMGELDAAHAHFYRSLKLFTQLDDYIGVSKVYTNLGNQAFVKEDYDGAIHFYERSEEIVLHFNLQSTWATACNYSNMGMAAQRQSQHERADGFFKQAYADFKELGHRARIAATCLHWSALYAELGNHEAEAAIIHEALTVAYALDNDYLMAHALVSWIRYLLATDEATGVCWHEALVHHPQLPPDAQQRLETMRESLPDTDQPCTAILLQHSDSLKQHTLTVLTQQATRFD